MIDLDDLPGAACCRRLGRQLFPNVVTLAATWDRRLARRFGLALGEEFRGKGLSADFGPTVNIVRTWHDGRSAETFGEDPYLTGELAVAEILGLQSRGVIATVKHFAGNNTTFELGDLAIAGAGADRTVGVSLKNTGRRAGAEVVQLYVGLPVAAADPPRQRHPLKHSMATLSEAMEIPI